MTSCKIIAELSANHNGKKELAIDTIKAFADTGISGIKIQTYTADTMTININRDPFIVRGGTLWDGKSFYDLYDQAHTPWEWHDDLRDCAESLGLVFFSTPFDLTAVDFLEEKNVPLYKIASFELVDIPLVEYVASKLKPMIMSTGIATIEETEDAVNACRRMGNNQITLLHCISSYPASPEEFNLKTMLDLKERFNVEVGLSDHSLHNEVSLAAVAMGATVIEKHVILDRAQGGPDAPFSVEPKEMKQLVDSIQIVETSLGKVDYSLTDKKIRNRHFARSLFVTENIHAGEVFTIENTRSIRPGVGISPKNMELVIGKMAAHAIVRGTPVTWELVK